MNRSMTTLLVTLLTVVFAVSCSMDSAPQFRAGAAAVDITPAVWPLPLIGSFSYRPATSAHDPLHVRAIALDDSIGQLVAAVCVRYRDISQQPSSDNIG